MKALMEQCLSSLKVDSTPSVQMVNGAICIFHTTILLTVMRK